MIQPAFTRIPAQELFLHIGQLLEEGYEAAFTVTGNSMWPLLTHGRDRVVLENCKDKPLKKGDIILFSPTKGRYMLHRIDWIKDGFFRTAGDGNSFRDGTFSRNCVLGRVVTVVRKGKTISCRNLFCRLYGRIWMALFRFRTPILRLLRKLAARHKEK